MRKYARDIFRTAEFFYKSYDERVDFLRINLAPGIVIPPGPVSIDNLGDPLDKLATRGFSAEVKRAIVKSPKRVERYRGAKAEGTWEAWEQKYLGSYRALLTLKGPKENKQRKIPRIETQANKSQVQKGTERDFERQAVEIIKNMKRPFIDGVRHLKMKPGTRASFAEAVVQLDYQMGSLHYKLDTVAVPPLKETASTTSQQEKVNLVRDVAKISKENVELKRTVAAKETEILQEKVRFDGAADLHRSLSLQTGEYRQQLKEERGLVRRKG